MGLTFAPENFYFFRNIMCIFAMKCYKNKQMTQSDQNFINRNNRKELKCLELIGIQKN